MTKSIYETGNFQFELIDGNSQKRNIDALLEDFDISSLPLNTTKKDYLIACCIGAISGFVDAFFVNEISLDKAAIWGQKEVNQFVMFMARRSGYIGDDLTGAIRQLEKHVIVSDSVMSEFGGSNQHHLRDFSHHFSLLGLVCSIYMQFSGKVIGTDEHGQLKTVRVAKELLGKNTEEKIYLGTVDWLFHMASDMAGSVRSPGKGTGIPGPLLSFLKEISALPFFRSGKADEINFRQWISKLFNGTAFANRDANNKLIPQRFDLRCEIGLLAEVAKSSLPVIINECVTRAYYFVKQLTLVIKDKTINDFGGINDAFLKEILPFNNVSLTRLLTISHGVMISIDMTDAVIRGAIETYLEGKQKGFYRIALRVNYPGIGRFVISGFIDTKNTVRRASAIKDQVSKTVAKGIDLKAFSLTAKQARIYWSLLYNIVLKDCSETKTKNVRDRKKLWLADWTNKTLLTIGIPSVELAEFFLSEKQIKKAIKEELFCSNNPYWLYSIAVDLLCFRPYYLMHNDNDQFYKKLSINQNFNDVKFKLLYEIDPSVSKIVHNLIQSESAVRKELIGKQSIQKKIAGALIVTITAGGLAYVFAPMIAPVIVGVISEGTVAGLYGVALTNASLAYLGFGSLAAGGYGMAGGTVLLSSGGALLAFLSSASTVAVSEWQNKDLNKYVLESVEKIALMSDRVLSKEYRDKETIKGIIKQLKSAKKTIDQLKRNPCVLIDEWDKLTEREKKKREKIVKDNLQYTGSLLSKCESMLKYDCEMIDIYIETETAIADLKKRYDIME